jgi:hypothetical protein
MALRSRLAVSVMCWITSRWWAVNLAMMPSSIALVDGSTCFAALNFRWDSG